jgi:propionate CoA-transferase
MRVSPVVCTAAEAISQIGNGVTVASSGFRYAGTPESLLAALGARHAGTGSPSQLTLIFSSAQGNNDGTGLDCLARPGLLKRVIGGFFGVTPGLVKCVQENQIEAYNWPQGVLTRLYHAVAGGQPGVLTRSGLGTFVDPRNGGGRLNDGTQERLSSIITIDGEDYILYKSLPIDVCLLRLTSADISGNLSAEKEAVKLEWLPLAMATRNSGGMVIAQVERILDSKLHPRLIDVPSHLVDFIVPAEEPERHHRQCVNDQYNPLYNGDEVSGNPESRLRTDVTAQIIGRRALGLLRAGEVINVGSGIPEVVTGLLAAANGTVKVHVTFESGVNGGVGAPAPDFGIAGRPESILRQDDQFNYYEGGGLDTALLGFAQIDGDGNVNVSKFEGRMVGCGGFIDIAHAAKRVVLCGTFNAKGLQVEHAPGRLTVRQNGRIRKFVESVEQITFNAKAGVRRGQEVCVVTERCVMRLTPDGWMVTEVAPGVDVQRDIIQQMAFQPLISSPLAPMSVDFVLKEEKRD